MPSWAIPRSRSTLANAWNSVGHPIRLPAARGESSAATSGGSCRDRRSTTGSTASIPSSANTGRQFLRFGRPRRKRPDHGRLPGAAPINDRPLIVDLRRRYGDWEGDTIVSRGRRGGLLSLVERKSGYTLLARIENLCAATVRRAAQQHLAPLLAHLRRTMTFDNGKEFAEHEDLAAAAGMSIFFARPYCAWQRGTNEHTNGLVRQYLPKGTDLTAYSHREVAAIQSSLNDRPRKRLGYLTPREVLTHNAARHGVAIGG